MPTTPQPSQQTRRLVAKVVCHSLNWLNVANETSRGQYTSCASPYPHRIEAGLIPRVLGAALKWSISWGGGGGGGGGVGVEVGQDAHTIAKECN